MLYIFPKIKNSYIVFYVNVNLYWNDFLKIYKEVNLILFELKFFDFMIFFDQKFIVLTIKFLRV